jgi:hypothetical protein
MSKDHFETTPEFDALMLEALFGVDSDAPADVEVRTIVINNPKLATELSTLVDKEGTMRPLTPEEQVKADALFDEIIAELGTLVDLDELFTDEHMPDEFYGN